MVLAEDPRLEAARTFLAIADLFNHWLSGSKACEFTNATTTQCFNPISRSWAFPLLEALGIPIGMFLAVYEPGTALGPLLSGVAAQTGAGRLPVIAPACRDTGSAVAAVPAQCADFAWLSSGSWSIMGAEVRQPEVSPQALAYNLTNEGGVGGTWRLSKNIMGLWLVQECKREWGLYYDVLTVRTVVAGPVEATAIGNVLMQAIALGRLGSLAEARALVQRPFALERYSPNPVPEWDEAMAKLASLTHLDLSASEKEMAAC